MKKLRSLGKWRKSVGRIWNSWRCSRSRCMRSIRWGGEWVGRGVGMGMGEVIVGLGFRVGFIVHGPSWGL